MMELKRFRAVGGNGPRVFDVGLGMREERKEGQQSKPRQHLALVGTAQLPGNSPWSGEGAD